jgi:hypothetical protein
MIVFCYIIQRHPVTDETEKDYRISMLRERIHDLENGACRFNCRTAKSAFEAGWKARMRMAKTKINWWEDAYKEWRNEKS